MGELNQKEVNEQMYLFVKQWLDDLPFEEYKKVPVMAIGYCMARLSKQDALLKEQEETIDTLYSILNDVCKDVREETEGDHVCGLCEYDGAHKTDSGDWAGECPGFESADCFCMKNEIRKLCGKELI